MSSRPYLKSHPWLTFKLDMTRASPQLWIALGEAASKCEHLAEIPLKPDLAEKLHQVYLAKGVLASTAIEGNTLSEEQAIKHVRGTLNLPQSQEYLANEMANVIEAFNAILDRIKDRGSFTLTRELLLFFNETVLKGLALEDGAKGGRFRVRPVGVGTYRGAPAEDCEYLIDRLCDWIEGADFATQSGTSPVITALVQAVVAHVYFVLIHPFDDGNGRTARLIEAVILLRGGVPSSAAHLLSNHYNKTRSRYYARLAEVSANGGDLVPFLDYAIRGFVDLLRECIDTVKLQQIRVAWENFIYEEFGEKDGGKNKRLRNVVLAITNASEPPKSEKDVRELSRPIMIEYLHLNDKTLGRDLSELIQRDLIEHAKDGYRARIERMLAFLPETNPELRRLLNDAVFNVGGRQMNLFSD